MLTQPHRFHGHNSLRYVYRHGQAVRTSQLIVRHLDNPRRTASRFSVVVSKKVLKSAVLRNRVRRRLYEIVRHELPTLRSGVDVVFIVVSPEVLTLDHATLNGLVRQLFASGRLYK